MADKKYENAKLERLPSSEVEITAEIPVAVLDSYKPKALKKLQDRVDLPGFRKGHVPDDVLLKTVGDYAVLEETAELALRDAYPELILDNNIDAIGRPEIAVTKLAPGNPLSFKAKTPVMPELSLPDYKTIAKEVMVEAEELTPSEKEIEDSILHLRRMVAWQRKEAANASGPKDGSAPQAPARPPTPGGAGRAEDIEEKDLPAFNDTFVQGLSADFKDVADFKSKLTAQMAQEKALRAKEKKRIAIGDKLVSKTKITLPQIFTDAELDKMMAQFKGDVARAQVKFEDYLKHANKTEEDLRKEWRPDAEKRAVLQLVLNEIAKKEKVSAPQEDVEKNLGALLEHNKDADPAAARIYISTVITNGKVFEFLEGQK